MEQCLQVPGMGVSGEETIRRLKAGWLKGRSVHQLADSCCDEHGGSSAQENPHSRAESSGPRNPGAQNTGSRETGQCHHNNGN